MMICPTVSAVLRSGPCFWDGIEANYGIYYAHQEPNDVGIYQGQTGAAIMVVPWE
jgi:hypothetical protein